MNSPLQLLVIDDNPDDRSLVIRELRREFPDLDVREVIDETQMADALAHEKFSLVITDYQLRWTDGVSVLRRLKAQWPDCPVIMFTGTGSEEVAVEAMKAGLDDYVLKSPKHFARLCAAATMALKAAGNTRALKIAEHRYQHLFNEVPVGLFRITPNGEILDANPALLKLLECSSVGDLVQRGMVDMFVNPQGFTEWRDQLERAGELAHSETQLRRFDGRLLWVETHAKVLRDSATNQIYYEGSIEDVTDRKVAEQDREHLISSLQEALGRVKTLSGLLPICSSCKKIRDRKGYWNQIEMYIQSHSQAEFTHSFCPDCMKNLYPEVFASQQKETD